MMKFELSGPLIKQKMIYILELADTYRYRERSSKSEWGRRKSDAGYFKDMVSATC